MVAANGLFCLPAVVLKLRGGCVCEGSLFLGVCLEEDSNPPAVEEESEGCGSPHLCHVIFITALGGRVQP